MLNDAAQVWTFELVECIISLTSISVPGYLRTLAQMLPLTGFHLVGPAPANARQKLGWLPLFA
jgi:hypothetical protein